MRYALLSAPSANRVYAAEAPRLTCAELAVFAGSVLAGAVHDIAAQTLYGLRAVTFTGELTGTDLAYLANLSSLYALFERVPVVADRAGSGDAVADAAGEELWRPVQLRPLARFDDDLITIPKYAGKTNEQFTRLLLNVTVLASASAAEMLDRPLTVLDPLCGRGTTLNQALMYGYDGIGIELDGKDVDAYSAFLRTWAQRKRIKHRTETTPLRRERKLVGRRFTATIDGRALTVLHADTLAARDFLRAGCADVIVADTPYGVAHGSHSGGSRVREPLALLRAAVPIWTQLVRPGGAIGLSWNTLLAGRDEAAAVLTDAGLAVQTGPGYLDFAHRVDQGITRDILVARRPG